MQFNRFIIKSSTVHFQQCQMFYVYFFFLRRFNIVFKPCLNGGIFIYPSTVCNLAAVTFCMNLPVVLGEDVQWRSIVSASGTDHLQVHRGWSVKVHSFVPVLFGLQPSQRLLLSGLLRTRWRSRLRVIISRSHESEKLENSPVETKVTARRSSWESSAAN